MFTYKEFTTLCALVQAQRVPENIADIIALHVLEDRRWYWLDPNGRASHVDSSDLIGGAASTEYNWRHGWRVSDDSIPYELMMECHQLQNLIRDVNCAKINKSFAYTTYMLYYDMHCVVFICVFITFGISKWTYKCQCEYICQLL